MVSTAKNIQEFLELPHNRQALKLFGQAEMRRLDTEVLRDLAQAHPSLDRTRQVLQSDFDPVAVVYQWELGVKLAKLAAHWAKSLTVRSSRQMAQDIQYIADNIQKIAPEYEAFSRGEKQKYAEVAQAINHLAAQRKTTLDSLVGQESFRNEVLRMVFLDKVAAEEFFANYVRVARLFPESAAAMRRITERVNIVRALNGIEYIPTKEASEALLGSSEKYIERRLDEIYESHLNRALHSLTTHDSSTLRR